MAVEAFSPNSASGVADTLKTSLVAADLKDGMAFQKTGTGQVDLRSAPSPETASPDGMVARD